MDREYSEIVCVGKTGNKALFVDEAGDLAYKDDPNDIYELGDTTTYGNLLPFSELPLKDRKSILKIIVEE